MLAFSFEAQTQRVKDVCLRFTLSSVFFHPFIFPIYYFSPIKNLVILFFNNFLDNINEIENDMIKLINAFANGSIFPLNRKINPYIIC